MGQVIQPADVRSRLREALEIDLVGPGTGHSLADERLPGWVRPSNWYLTGFLVPRDAPAEQRADADADDDFEHGGRRETGGTGRRLRGGPPGSQEGLLSVVDGVELSGCRGRRRAGRDRPLGRLPLRQGRVRGRRRGGHGGR